MFKNQFGKSGLLDTWIKLDEPYGAMCYMYFFSCFFTF